MYIICIGSIHTRANVGGRDGRTYVLYYIIIIARAERVPTRTGGLSLLFVPRPGFIKVRSSAVYIYILYFCIPLIIIVCTVRGAPAGLYYTCTAHVHAFVYNTAATVSIESVCPSPCESSRAALYCCCAYCIYNATSATDTTVTNSINNLNKLMGYNKSSVSHYPLPHPRRTHNIQKKRERKNFRL